jgi:hypothetical protein
MGTNHYTVWMLVNSMDNFLMDEKAVKTTARVYVLQWQQCWENFSIVASELSPFSKNASRRGEHWQGHSEEDCNWRFAKTEDFFFALFHTLWLQRRKTRELQHSCDNHQAVFGLTKSDHARPPSIFARFSTRWLLFVPISEIHLKGHLFDSISDIQKAVTSTLETIEKDNFYKGIHKLYDHANLCVQ